MTRIVGLSYDFAARPRTLEGVTAKLMRDGRAAEEVFFVVCGQKRERFTLSPKLRGESFRAPLWFRPWCDLLFVYKAPKILRDADFTPEEILIPDFPLVWAAIRVRKKFGGQIVLHLGGLSRQLAGTRSVFHRIYYLLCEKLLWRKVDRFIAINQATQMYLLTLGIPSEKITIRPPNTITPELELIAQVQKGQARQHFGIGAEDTLIVSAGRLEPEKAFDELIDVFSQSGVAGTLVIAGEGKLRVALESQIARLKLSHRVILAGQLDRKSLWELYANANVFVLLSKSEALGMVVWEAMYADVAVIGRPIGGIEESIGADGERGFFWNTSDGPRAFAQKVEMCMKNDEQIRLMKERAKEYVKKQLSL